MCGVAMPIWIVKANAYGHGAVLLAKEIEKTIGKKREWFGVDSLDEAISLRQEGIVAPIIVLGWVTYPRLKELKKNNLRLLVSSLIYPILSLLFCGNYSVALFCCFILYSRQEPGFHGYRWTAW